MAAIDLRFSMEDSYLKLLRTRKTCLSRTHAIRSVPQRVAGGGNKEKSPELLNEYREAAANARVITAPETDPTAAAKQTR